MKNSPEGTVARGFRALVFGAILLTAVWAQVRGADLRLYEAALHFWFPTLIAIAFFIFVKPKTRTGGHMVTLTMALILAALFYPELALVILRGAPLFYALVILLGVLQERREHA